MRTEDIEYFLAIADEGHVGRAALRLGVTQSALSKCIQRLEEQLGFRLFDRTPKGVSPTPSAQTLMGGLRSAHRQIADAVREATDAHLGDRGSLGLGVAPLMLDAAFTRAIQRLREQRPGVRLSVSLNLNDVLTQELLNGTLDLIFCALSAETPEGLRAEPMFEDYLCPAASANHPLASKSLVRLEDLVGYDWMLPRRSVSIRNEVERCFAARGLPAPVVGVEINVNSNSLLPLVSHSQCLTMLTEHGLRSLPGSGVVLLNAHPEIRWRRRLGIMTRLGGYLPPVATRFVELLRQERAS